MTNYSGLGNGSGFCPMNLIKDDLESMTIGQFKNIGPRDIDELGKLIPGHWGWIGQEGMKESSNTNLAKLIARRLIKHIEVAQPQDSAWLLMLTMSDPMPEPYERTLLSMTAYTYRLLASASRCQRLDL